MKSRLAIQRELLRVKRALAMLPPGHPWEKEQYGAQQALSWALGDNAAPPSTLVPGPPKTRKK